MVGRRELDSVVEHVVAVHAVAREEGARVAALVLEDPLVADRVERDRGPRVDREDRRVSGAREAPPQHGVELGRQIGGRRRRARSPVQDLV